MERLPAHERIVVALFYLGGYSQHDIATFLEVPVSTVKKRSFDARQRLKGQLQMVEKTLGQARPSRTNRFSDTVLLFAALRRGDTAAVRRELARRPDLANAREDWSPEQARAAGLHFAGGATPLVRAAESGEIEVVRALVDSGAQVDEPCSCETAESPLWAAIVAGRSEVAAYLLDQGADPNLPAAHAVTPLHAAVIRGAEDLARTLLERGADPNARDSGGRTPVNWAELHGTPELTALLGGGNEAVRGASHGPDASVPRQPVLQTGIKALDLFAPLRRGSLVYWHGSYGLGQMVVLSELMKVLARPPARSLWIGFEWELIDARELRQLTDEAGLGEGIEVRLARATSGESTRRATFLEATAELERELDRGVETLLFMSQRPGHAADLESVYPRLAGRPSLIATVIVSPASSGEGSQQTPAGCDAQVALDKRRACRRLYPAIDLSATHSKSLDPAVVGEHHCLLAQRARNCLKRYDVVDPELHFPAPDSLEDPALARRARRIHAYLSQPFHVAEPFEATPGASVPPGKTLRDIERILDGELDELDEGKLSYIADLSSLRL